MSSSVQNSFKEEDESIMTQSSIQKQIPYAVAFLGVVGVIGLIGNFLVILIYARKSAEKQTANLFILVLGVVDFLTCLVLIPFTMFNEVKLWRIGSNFACKTYYVLNGSNVPFSSLLIFAIALDRYLCICHPFWRVMTVRRAKFLVISLAIFSLALGSLVAVFAKMQLVQPAPTIATPSQIGAILNGTSTTYILARTTNGDRIGYVYMTTAHPAHKNHIEPQPECSDWMAAGTKQAEHQKKIQDWAINGTNTSIFGDINLSNTPSPFMYISFQIIQKANHAVFAICFLSVLVLYVHIYSSITKMRRKKMQLLGKDRNRSTISAPSTMIKSTSVKENMINNNNGNPNVTIISNPHYGDSKPMLDTDDIENGDNSPNQDAIPLTETVQQRVDTQSTGNNNMDACNILNEMVLQNLKTAGMLFVVAVVFFVSFTPAVLMANKLVSLNLVVFYLYYVNNSINPIIYGFMNQNFRQDIHRLLKSMKKCRNRN